MYHDRPRFVVVAWVAEKCSVSGEDTSLSSTSILVTSSAVSSDLKEGAIAR